MKESPVPMHPNAIKLHESHIPDWTHKVTLATEGYGELEESLKNKGYMVDNGSLSNFYVQADKQDDDCMVRASRVASLIAKQLRLSGVPVIQVGLSGMLTAYRLAYTMEREITPYNPVISCKGEGYIVIPNLHAHLDPLPGIIWNHNDLEDIAEWLVSHVHSGGGLILAGYDRFHDQGFSEDRHHYTLSCFGNDLCAMIQHSFTVQLVK